MVSLNPLSWFRRGGDNDPEFTKALAMATTHGASSQSMSKEEFAKMLGVNKELIHDTWEELELEKNSYFYGYDKDEKGNINSIYPVAVNWDMRALRTLSSQLNRVSFITEKQAVLLKLYAERALIGIEMNMDEADFDMGMANYFDAKRIQILQAIDESIHGRKAKLLKVIPRVTTIEVNPERKKEGGIL